MSKYKYSTTKLNENTAKCVGMDLGISTKQSIEICNHIRGRDIIVAKKILNDAIALKKAIPFRRFTNGIGHRKGDIASGSYAPTACKSILKIIESAESNAQYKGINTSNLVLSHISAQKGTSRYRYGRKSRQKMKSTHIEVVLEEQAKEVKQKLNTKKAGSDKK